MSKQKACKKCQTIYEGDKCPNCGSAEFVDNFKGRIIVLNPEKSEVAQKINMKKQGTYAIRIR